MELNLKQPVVFLDIETTGTDVATDRIVEIAMLKIEPNGKETVYEKKVNPTIPIPTEISEIHGI
jgi:DNA polymerase-3 subunit epsilon